MATTDSSASSAHPFTPLELLAERIEAEVVRLRERRPALTDRLDRATGIIVQHLARPRSRIIRVRVGTTSGRCRYLVSSISSTGAVYVVDPGDWSCSCPDAHRRGKGCKHSLACYLLWQTGCPRR